MTTDKTTRTEENTLFGRLSNKLKNENLLIILQYYFSFQLQLRVFQITNTLCGRYLFYDF